MNQDELEGLSKVKIGSSIIYLFLTILFWGMSSLCFFSEDSDRVSGLILYLAGLYFLFQIKRVINEYFKVRRDLLNLENKS
jgi:hypothetical protein